MGQRAIPSRLSRHSYHPGEQTVKNKNLDYRVEEHDCDVVLTDLRMGGMDGLALVRAIHATRPETPVILMTAFGGIDTAIEAVKAGAYHFVAKPVKLPEVGAWGRKA